MSVTLHWHDPDHSALMLTFRAPWTWAEFERLDDDLEAAFNSVAHTVDLLIDLRDAGPMPPRTFYRLRDAYADSTINIGQYVFIGADADFIHMLTTADRYYSALGGRLEFTFVDSLDALPTA